MRFINRALIAAMVFAAGVVVIAGQQNAARGESNGTPEARAAFVQAEQLRVARKYADAAPLYKKAADLDPLFAEAHWQYIWNTQLADTDRVGAQKRLRAEYTALAANRGASPVHHWAVGKLTDDYAEAEKHFRRAIELEPAFARAYQDLALIADFRGENDKQTEYLRKASELNPDDPSYLFYYASAIRDDVELYKKLSLEVARKFPAHERGAQALYWLAFRETDPAEKVALYERLRRDYPPAKFSWSSSGMTGLFDAYQATAPDKALALARDMAGQSEGSAVKTWQQILAMQEAVVKGRALLAEKKPAEALALLEAVTPYRYVDQVEFQVLRADARAGAGDRQKAYDELVAAIATEPLEPLEAAAMRHGAALGRSQADVIADMWRVRESKAKPAAPFSLPDYYAPGKSVSLADYRGRVVLVNFWYPACGPCRGEFPYLQHVAEKYRSRGFEVLALNVHPDEDAFVVPYMRNNKFLFRPLKTDAAWAKDNYGAIGMPSNYLVDHEGRIMFKPGVINGEKAEKVFERQLQQLLERAEASRSKSSK
jgi:thiol-disulfide isomerase/thioredoxin/Flp pilus assembly protein TadD